ncbi:hypothetical protein HY745_01630 [Candidatus Desantisbacteria bacterium]|nr:hypothetical protein [Candidatus Desantisbacteria bacterium]
MGKIFNDIKKVQEFEKDLKKLSKRFRTLEEDLDTFINNQLKLYHKLNIDNSGIFHISNLPLRLLPLRFTLGFGSLACNDNQESIIFLHPIT